MMERIIERSLYASSWRLAPVFVGLSLALLALVGCGNPDDAAAEGHGGSRIPDDNVFRDQVRALEQAEDVSKTLDAAAARQRGQMDRDSR